MERVTKKFNLTDFQIILYLQYRNNIEATANLPEMPSCNAAVEPEDIEIVEDIANVDDQEILTTECIHDANDREKDDELVGRQIKALYENGWFTGKIKYSNKKMCKYIVQYGDRNR